MKATTGMAKVSLRYARIPQLMAAVGFALGIIAYIVSYLVDNSRGQNVAVGNFLFLLPLSMAIFIPYKYFAELMNLGGKRKEFFKSAILAYAPTSAAAALANIVTRYTIDRAIVGSGKLLGVLDLLDVFGFASHGPVIAFLQMTAFLLMFCCVLHTLTLVQGRWYGWVVDVLIIVIIFSPQNSGLRWLFNMLIFHDVAIIQIFSCLIFGAAVYFASLIPIMNKQI